MKDRHYTDQQFNHILDVLIQYKKCVPEKDVYLNETSIKEAFEYFMKTGIFERLVGSSSDADADADEDEEADEDL
jgi:hypothetical protein